jgi:hypothetical protein
MMTNPSPQQTVFEDVFLLGLAVLLFVLASGVETGRPLKPGVHSFFLGVYIVYLGSLFLLSYCRKLRVPTMLPEDPSS